MQLLFFSPFALLLQLLGLTARTCKRRGCGGSIQLWGAREEGEREEEKERGNINGIGKVRRMPVGRFCHTRKWLTAVGSVVGRGGF